MAFVAKCNFIHNRTSVKAGEVYRGEDCDLLLAKGLIDGFADAPKKNVEAVEDDFGMESDFGIEEKPKKKGKKA